MNEINEEGFRNAEQENKQTPLERYKERLMEKKARAESNLKNINETIDLLKRNPESFEIYQVLRSAIY